ncbi:Dehydrogenase reductase SDR member 4 [Perkinsus chesapeaki]|uniref:Dehydrogenase reductase SDR member 4 n=1 Tax=Perkinsus chesapeaki TaxID=330153 RepID=A0A7J6LKD2_PERCH|nr:Dehydrogenase reductase SDR member 4 [Perkinsus chesapeaki]
MSTTSRRTAEVLLMILLTVFTCGAWSNNGPVLEWLTVLIFFFAMYITDLVFFPIDKRFIHDPFYSTYSKLTDPHYEEISWRSLSRLESQVGGIGTRLMHFYNEKQRFCYLRVAPYPLGQQGDVWLRDVHSEALDMTTQRAPVPEWFFEDSMTPTQQTLTRFDGRVSVVTASTAGIGKAIAKRILQEGGKVIISSRKQSSVDAALSELKPLFGDRVAGKKLPNHLLSALELTDLLSVICNVSNAADRAALLEAAKAFGDGKIDVLVSNAASNIAIGPTDSCDDRQWDKMFENNVKSAWQLTTEFKPYMRRGTAAVLFVTSIAAFSLAPPLSVYGVTKTALTGLMKALAYDLGPEGIRVNALAPGIVKTKFSELLWKNEGSSQLWSGQSMLKRIAEPEEMAGPAAFLCSDDASFVTGETLIASGGVSSRL